MNDKINSTINVLPPFKYACMTIGELPSSYLETMTYYETLVWLCKYLKETVIPTVNNNGLATKELQELFVKLQDYVNNYFDNLDVQDEINNKLDEMALDGTLEAMISDYILNGKGQVKYVFPSRTQLTSEFNLITGYDKNILIDCGLNGEYQNLTDTLYKYNITHIDYLIITHFHVDHCGNLINLYNDEYCDNNTTLILPSFNTTVWASNTAYDQYVAIMQYLNTNNISHITPTEGYTITINDNFKLKIYNTNDTYYVDSSINSDYNNASLFVLVNHFDNYSLYIGDAYKHALKKIYNDGKIPDTLHIFKMGHHGNDNRNISIIETMRNLNIMNAVQIVGMNDIDSGKCTRGGTASDIRTITKNIFVSAYNNDNIQFSSFINSFELNSGFNECGTDNLNFCEETIYVDANTNQDKQDGSSTKPFKNLLQALGYINRNNGKDYTINVADGTYDTYTSSTYSDAVPTLYGVTNTIKIKGSGENCVLKHGFKIFNCLNISIEDLNIENKMEARGINILNSNVTIKNITFKNEEGNSQYFLYAENSNVILDTIEVSDVSYGVYEYNSIIEIDTIEFSNVANFCLYGRNGVFRRSDNITVTDESVLHGRYSASEKPLFEKGLVIFTGSQKFTDGGISDLLARPARFRRIDIVHTINTYSLTKSFEMNDGNIVCGLNDVFVANDGKDYMYSSTLQVSDAYTASFTYSRSSVTDRSTGDITYTNDTDTYTISKIIAH